MLVIVKDEATATDQTKKPLKTRRNAM